MILTNPDLSGDAVIDAVALATPPGARVRMMGIQNIKGTALDFVYRWVSIEQVHRSEGDIRLPACSTRLLPDGSRT